MVNKKNSEKKNTNQKKRDGVYLYKQQWYFKKRVKGGKWHYEAL